MAAVKTVFMASDAIALPVLKELLKHHGREIELIGLITQPDRPKGRGLKVHANAIKQHFQPTGLPVLQPQSIGPVEMDWLRQSSCALILVMAYGHFLQQALLDLPRLGALNIHPSLLPAYRGATPIEGALASSDAETGTTLMRISMQMDAGPILSQLRLPISPEDTAPRLRAKLADLSARLLGEHLPEILANAGHARPQDEQKASYTRPLTKADAGLDFSAPAQCLANRIRALQPWPGTCFQYQGQRIKVAKASFRAGAVPAPPCTVLAPDREALVVATGDGVLLLRKLQRPGGRMLPAADFLRGLPIPQGTLLESLPMPPLVSPTPFAKQRKTPRIYPGPN